MRPRTCACWTKRRRRPPRRRSPRRQRRPRLENILKDGAAFTAAPPVDCAGWACRSQALYIVRLLRIHAPPAHDAGDIQGGRQDADAVADDLCGKKEGVHVRSPHCLPVLMKARFSFTPSETVGFLWWQSAKSMLCIDDDQGLGR